MLLGILLAGIAPIGLGGTTTLAAFYTFYLMNALGYVTGGPLPNQVMLSRWFDAGRGKAMGIAYIGIGVGGALVPLLAHALTESLGWRTALQVIGVLMIAIAFLRSFDGKVHHNAQLHPSPKRLDPSRDCQPHIESKKTLPRVGTTEDHRQRVCLHHLLYQPLRRRLQQDFGDGLELEWGWGHTASAGVHPAARALCTIVPSVTV